MYPFKKVKRRFHAISFALFGIILLAGICFADSAASFNPQASLRFNQQSAAPITAGQDDLYASNFRGAFGPLHEMPAQSSFAFSSARWIPSSQPEAATELQPEGFITLPEPKAGILFSTGLLMILALSGAGYLTRKS